MNSQNMTNRIEQKIISVLKERSGYVSGEQISNSLDISRQGLWKHIQALKENGYDIAAVPHLGYKLFSAPDRLFPFEVTSGLRTRLFGKNIYYFEQIHSTMDTAGDFGSKGAAEGTLIIAETQTKGRGRLGRTWSSPKYKGIYISLILKPRIPPSCAPILTLLSGVSVCEAVQNITGVETQIKWPNDVIIEGKKLAGILTELNAETDEVKFAVVGIGINVNNEKKSLLQGATSLKEHTNEEISRVELLKELLRVLEENYQLFEKKGSGVIADKWKQLSITLGKRVRINCLSLQIEGEALDIDCDGALLVRNDSGLINRITSGDVIHCR